MADVAFLKTKSPFENFYSISQILNYSSIMSFYLKETDASRRCMDESNYNKNICSTYFLNYKNCRKFWVSILEISPCVVIGMLSFPVVWVKLEDHENMVKFLALQCWWNVNSCWILIISVYVKALTCPRSICTFHVNEAGWGFLFHVPEAEKAEEQNCQYSIYISTAICNSGTITG